MSGHLGAWGPGGRMLGTSLTSGHVPGGSSTWFRICQRVATAAAVRGWEGGIARALHSRRFRWPQGSTCPCPPRAGPHVGACTPLAPQSPFPLRLTWNLSCVISSYDIRYLWGPCCLAGPHTFGVLWASLQPPHLVSCPLPLAPSLLHVYSDLHKIPVLRHSSLQTWGLEAEAL